MRRRHFLRNVSQGVFLALPVFESTKTLYAMPASTVSADIPKRAVFVAMGYGVTKESWFPKSKDKGKNYTMPKGLKPLEKHRNNMTVFQNLYNQYSNEGHWGSTFWLTGANRYLVPGQSFHNSISVDQVIAQQFGVKTRYTSIQVKGGRKGDGHGRGGASWSKFGKPVAGDSSSLRLYHRLFSDSKASPEQTADRLRKHTSVLDAFSADAKTLQRGLSKRDVEKLDEYFQSIREVETRLEKEKFWLKIPRKSPEKEVKRPSTNLRGSAEMKAIYDLIALAMEVDASRVFTYELPVEHLIRGLGAEISAHSMSHYNEGERQRVSELRDRENSKLLSGFLDKLESSKQVDGSSLLDHTVVTMGSNLSSIHSLRNCPTLVAGGGAGFKHGKHLVMSKKGFPLCNLWLSILNGLGIDAESHGDSTGKIDELFA